MSTIHHTNKESIKAFSKTLYDGDRQAVQATLGNLLMPEAVCHFSHPLGDVTGAGLYEEIFVPIFSAFPDLERRDVICISGSDQEGQDWVGCAGHYAGRFMAPFFGIPPTGHIADIRFHEYYRFVDAQIVEIQAIWDLPGLMMQAGVWPMAPSLGRDGYVPGPASQDGLAQAGFETAKTAANLQHVLDMLESMQRYPSQGGADIMELDKFWHPHFNWYGPSGIGSCRGVDGFRTWHQTPFLNAMPDRGQHPQETEAHFFAEGDYVAVTGWPNMAQTLTGDGWLGMAPIDKKITLRSLDFWRLEDGLIRENWVLVDLLDIWAQIGVNVMARMAELGSARPGYGSPVYQGGI